MSFLSGSASANHRLNTDRWYYRIFQSAPDLIRALFPNRGDSASGVGLNRKILAIGSIGLKLQNSKS